MEDWQALGQSIFLGILFAFLIAKLLSVVTSFRDDNLKIVREDDLPVKSPRRYEESAVPPVFIPVISRQESLPPPPAEIVTVFEEPAVGVDVVAEKEQEKKPLVVKEDYRGDEDVDIDEEDDDDWEGIESTELDETFTAATAFVAAAAADQSATARVSNDLQLQLYGHYKIATEGPCSSPQPSPLQMKARAKWNAWQKLGTMTPEEAMQKYIAIVNELYPTWAIGRSAHDHEKSGNKDGDASSASRGSMGPVFSSLVHEGDSDNETKLEDIHVSAREGDIGSLQKHIELGIPVNQKDSDGRSALHWAVDRGHQDAVELLVSSSADVNVKDNEGQSPLHYAVLCEREVICKYLIDHGADLAIKDNDGNVPRDLCSVAWPCMNIAA